ncbi:MAG: bifunctional metallophosphatase/5'-nucleotidase [Leptospiraceae bacterium]|nr:bifunctional metallophosphatase/5'-nucleotidase [Leptospiraceae bacterium]MCP5511027.1 bifunctional metallophosphatase/5'-nucleotidase [Leptospiraceae bacterium]
MQILIPIILSFFLSLSVFGETVKITLLHLNDLYEITPVEGGRKGGLARVATARKKILKKNPNTLTVLGGDLFSPSALGTSKVDGVPLSGKQMVSVMNSIGVDVSVMGNHEFDIKEEQFLERLNESKFQWISGNVTDTSGKPFPGVLPFTIKEIKLKNSKKLKIGFVGVTITSNGAKYVKYKDPIETLSKFSKEIRSKVDILIGLTHLSLSEDIQALEKIPEIDLILGGHEHENVLIWRGRNPRPIIKADANAKSMYIVDIHCDMDSKVYTIHPRILPITEQMGEDPETKKLVDFWLEKGFEGFRKTGFHPEKVIANVTIPLDGLEESVRNKSTLLTQSLTFSMLKKDPSADLSLLNAGALRIDDLIPPGPVTEYDVLRILPFGGKIVKTEITGTLLKTVLDIGLKNKGTGGFLHSSNSDFDPTTNSWTIKGKPLDEKQKYTLVINDFLLSGKETGLPFLNPENPEIKIIEEMGDIRFAFIDFLKDKFAKENAKK